MANIAYVDCNASVESQVGEVLGESTQRALSDTLQRLDGFGIVAMEGGTPVGVIGVYTRRLPPPLPETDEGFINVIGVAESHRRQGIASKLVQLAIDRCRSRGLHQIRAWSSDDKVEAIPMWKAVGFALCPATEHPPGMEVQGYFVSLQL